MNPRIRHLCSTTALILLLFGVAAQAGTFKRVALGQSTDFDALSSGSEGTHVIFHNPNTGDFYRAVFSQSGRLLYKEPLPFPVHFINAMAVDSHNQPHIAYINFTAGMELNYATVNNGSWVTQPIPNPGCVPRSVVVDGEGNFYVPCVWSKGGGTTVASLLIYDGTSWTREDAAATRLDPDSQTSLEPNGFAFATIDRGGLVHLSYGLGGSFGPSSGARAVCDSVREQSNNYSETCHNVSSTDDGGIASTAVGPVGDPSFLYGNFQDLLYIHFDGESWTQQSIGPFSDFLDQKMTANGNGIPILLLAKRSGEQVYLYYALLSADGMQSQRLGSWNNPGGLDIKTDDAGIPHFGFITAKGQLDRSFYQFAVQPDLTVKWVDISLTKIRNKTKIVGHLSTSSDGTAAAQNHQVLCYLSGAPIPSPTDPVIGKANISLPAGRSRVITFSFDPSQAPSGKYIVAQISSAGSEDSSPNGKIAATLIP